MTPAEVTQKYRPVVLSAVNLLVRRGAIYRNQQEDAVSVGYEVLLELYQRDRISSAYEDKQTYAYVKRHVYFCVMRRMRYDQPVRLPAGADLTDVFTDYTDLCCTAQDHTELYNTEFFEVYGHRFTAQERAYIELILLGYTPIEIAQQWKLSKARIYQIRNSVCEKARKVLRVPQNRSVRHAEAEPVPAVADPPDPADPAEPAG